MRQIDQVDKIENRLKHQVMCESDMSYLISRIRSLQDGLRLIREKELRHLYQTCLDCGTGCTHGAAYDPIIAIVDKLLESQ